MEEPPPCLHAGLHYRIRGMNVNMIMPKYYEFCASVRVLSGKKSLDQVADYLKKRNTTRPLIITDEGVSAVGLVKTVTKSLGKTASAIFDQVPMDSDLLVVQKIAALYRKKKCDSIIALGGGSVLDTAKGVNILVSLGGENLMDYAGAGVIRRRLQPLVAVPTTAGTGSEMTAAAVIADRKRNIKLTFVSQFLLPDLAVLDPRMTMTLPPHITAATAMDAMTHACEAYTCLAKNPLSDALSLKAIELLSQNLIDVMNNPKNEKGRLALANGATLAGMSFSNSMVGMVHNLGHSTGALCHVPHGQAMAIFLPYGLEYNLHKTARHTGELLYSLVGPEDFAATPEKKRPRRAIEAIRELNLGLHELTGGRHATCLKELTDREGREIVPREKLPDIARTALGDGASVYNPEESDFEDNLMVLEHAWEGIPLDLKKVVRGRRGQKF